MHEPWWTQKWSQTNSFSIRVCAWDFHAKESFRQCFIPRFQGGHGICVLYVLCFFLLNGQFIVFEAGASLHRHCEALRACEIMNELGIPRNDAWPPPGPPGLWFDSVGYCQIAFGSITGLYTNKTDLCLIEVDMAYCCSSFLAVSAGWLKITTGRIKI